MAKKKNIVLFDLRYKLSETYANSRRSFNYASDTTDDGVKDAVLRIVSVCAACAQRDLIW